MADDWEEIEALMFGDTIMHKTVTPIYNDHTSTPILHKDFDDNHADDDFLVRDISYQEHFPLSVFNLNSHLQATHQERSSSPDTYSDTTDTTDSDSKESLFTSLSNADTLFPYAKDDIINEPVTLHQVDYLSYTWDLAEDFWLSWRTLKTRRTDEENPFNNEFTKARLENAMWRTWTKQSSQLSTLDPERIAWTKDSDSTWLYGPFYRDAMRSGSRPVLAHSTTVDNADPLPLASVNSLSPATESLPPPRSILKKRTTKEIILSLPAQGLPCRLKKSVTI